MRHQRRPTSPRLSRGGAANRASGALLLLLAAAFAGSLPERAIAEAATSPAAPAERTLDVNEFQVRGATRLSEPEIQAALEPFLGPGRPLSDVERARAALEKAYTDRGWQAVAVSTPAQTVRDGVVTLDVTEGKVTRLKVVGARWFLPSEIRRLAPSVAEGTVPNFGEIVRDIFVLNQLPDRKVVPSIRAGVVPGTVVVDLDVKDRLPLHATLDASNRSSPGTTPTRLNGSLRYDNLFQLGHSLSLAFQVAPERAGDGKVLVLAYVARFPELTWLSLTLAGILQDSDVSTMGGTAVVGRGKVAGARTTFTLLATAASFQTISGGLDYKRFLERIDQDVSVAYWPVTVQYSGSWQRDASRTQLSASTVFALRTLGSSQAAFDAKRYAASGGFIYERVDLSREDDLPFGLAIAEKLQVQLAGDPVVGPEQLAAGGAESVRGYLEAQGVGDYGAVGQLEVRGPSLGRLAGVSWMEAWRLHAFADAGWVAVRSPLPEQLREVTLASVGVGARLASFDRIGGSVELGFPLRTVGDTRLQEPRLHFKLWSQY